MKAESNDSTELSGADIEPESDKGFVERLRRIASIAGSASALAKAAGISQGGMQRYMKGGEPTRKVLISLAECTGVSLEWLMTGSGPEEVGGGSPHISTDETYAYVPLYDARCSAGHGAWNENAKVLTMLAFTAYSLRKQGLTPSMLSAIRVDGDSMAGLLEDGDTVMIDHGRNQLEAEAVYVIRLDDHLYAKRLQRLFDGSVRIISENKAYGDVVVSKTQLNDLEIIGRVVWAGGWV
ncbi:MAG: helix-turn-helix transcriptional regulator [Pseudomonas sp.]|uniref:XRE family transcriptional regulator n=1 Tax=Pseudomonas sp. TaxID=306 RepID=UPI002394A429|nr:helix-turn-helix transcriptional regulator [Pseudomonas sp.]MDP9213436.1 helix-turn-helix transcriptional regulator [Pseudomonadota bacterium]MDE1909426.1 helix-turn-helix transcriptional regulator [Pseudomonas sp.]MDE2033380.1 helix-turn-helix transcriptional regulator [Pseudomonas sp.]MDE2191307.1 helix-turn-helix transcriptional regulator [Pseudomonas sp.]MDE2556679.1 helix-turn-helix transcriptional regulator [Pseudomonas sp.]